MALRRRNFSYLSNMAGLKSSRQRSSAGFRSSIRLMLFAVLVLVVYQPLDAAGHFASKAYQAGDHSLAVRAVAAFDVLGDSLDHDPASGKAPAAQQQIVVGLTCSLACAPLPFVAAHAAWTMLAFVLPPNQIVLELFRPPRA